MSKEQICIVWIFAMIALLIWHNQNRMPNGNFGGDSNWASGTIGESEIPVYPGVTAMVECNELDENLVKMATHQKDEDPPNFESGNTIEWFWRFDYIGSQKQVVEFYEQSYETIYVSFSKHYDEYGEPFTVYSLKAESTANCNEDVKWLVSILVYDDSIVISHFLYPRNAPVILEAEESIFKKVENYGLKKQAD